MNWITRLLGFTESTKVRESRRRHTDRIRQADKQRKEALQKYSEQVSTVCLPPKAKTR